MGQMQKVCKNNTKIETAISDLSGLETTYIQLHNTTVVTFDQNFIVLNTGGWKTVTTKARMNQASNQFNLGYRVSQNNHEWFVTIGNVSLPFEGHMVLNRRAM